MIELTKQEREFLLDLLDKINVQGIEGKSVVLGLMVKISKDSLPPVPVESTEE